MSNAIAVSFIKGFEQCRLTAYRDSKGVLTIGWGHTGPEVTPGLTWTQQQADDQFAKDLQHATDEVTRITAGHTLSTTQAGALISFVFNLGSGALEHSHLLEYVDAGNWMAAAHAFIPWDHIGSVELKGLLIRRLEEAALFLRGS